MATPDCATSGANSNKRKAENDGDALTRIICLKKVEAYNPKEEQEQRSVEQSKEWMTLNDGRTHILEILLGALEQFPQEDPNTQKLVAMVNDGTSNDNPDKILLGLTGLMNTGEHNPLPPRSTDAHGV